MRTCPVCNSDNRKDLWRMPFLVPDGWTNPEYIQWVKCECGMIYGDNPTIMQEDYNVYYDERYGYGVTDDQSSERLRERARFVSYKHDKSIRVVDFGGGDSVFSKELNNFGIEDTYNVGCYDSMPDNVDVVLASHVLEHIYDMDEAMTKITKALKPGGMFIVDIPDAGLLANDKPIGMPILDFHQKHINHFRMIDLLKLAWRYGFELVSTQAYLERMKSGCQVYYFVKNSELIYHESFVYVKNNSETKVNALKELGNQPVCVWGCGDVALHCLAVHWPNVKYFIDNDPAFRGATIKGLPVYEQPIDDLPIVINTQTQKKKLLEYIKSLGIKNRIIEI